MRGTRTITRLLAAGLCCLAAALCPAADEAPGPMLAHAAADG